MKLRRLVKPGERIPRGYGIAWDDPARYAAVCAPIGLHWILGTARRLYWDFVKPPPASVYDALRQKIADLENRLRIAQGHAEALVAELRLYKQANREAQANLEDWLRAARRSGGKVPEA